MCIPVGRIRARCLAVRLPNPPVRTVLAAFIAHGSREKDAYRKLPFRQLHGVHRGQLARSLATFVPFSARGPLPQGLSPCMWLSYIRPTMPYLTACRALESSLGSLPSYSPPSFTSLSGLSRVPYGGLKQDGVGGALSTVPSALCGSPDGAWGRSRFTHALFHRAYGVTPCRAYCCRHDRFCWSGWHHRQGMPGS